MKPRDLKLSTRLLLGGMLIALGGLWTTAQASPQAGLTYEAERSFPSAPRDSKTFDLRTLQSLERNFKKVHGIQTWIPENARRARNKDQFVQIVTEFHLREAVETQLLEDTSFGRRLKKIETFFSRGFSYKVSDSNPSKKLETTSKEATAKKESSTPIIAPPSVEQETSFKAFIDPQETRAHFLVEAGSFTADLFHDLGDRTTALKFVVPEFMKGQLTFLVSAKDNTEGNLGYSMTW